MSNNERPAETAAQTPTEAEVTTSACGGQDDEEENEWDVFDECLNCGSIWGIGSEEYDFQQCDACGWMPGEPTDDDTLDDDNDDELDYEPVS